MKKISQWLLELPEPYKSEAIENSRNKRLWTYGVDKRSASEITLSRALMNSFYWNMTPQGYDYWHDLYKELLAKE